jgi:rod shape determining protein RodA
MIERLAEKIKEFFSQADMVLLTLCCACSIFGIVLIASATRVSGSYRYVAVQGAALVLGLVAYFLFSTINVEDITAAKWKWIAGFNVLLIAGLVPFGTEHGGNRAWYELPFLPVSIQPAEIVKITFILLLAYQLSMLRGRKLSAPRSVAQYAGHLFFMVGLIYVISRDAGSCLVYVFVFLCMTFVAGVKLRWFALGGAAAAAGWAVVWTRGLLPTYMQKRFAVLFDHSVDPLGAGWHQTRSLIALGSGGWFGRGLFNGTQTQTGTLPARHTDFIFAVAGEELGMVGCIVIMIMLAAVVVRCLIVARRAKTDFAAFICVGMAGMLTFQIIENIGMCLFVMPVIGLTLPFFSYGGSSLITVFSAMGIVSGIKKRSLPSWLRT